MSRVAIIGSGLSAVSAAKKLIARGIKPVILDFGETIPNEIQSVINRMSLLLPEQWSDEDKEVICANNTINKKKHIQKLVFGSSFFYGDANKLFTSSNETAIPSPSFSLAYGGLGNGWGGAVLPADDCDLKCWPVTSKDLKKYYIETLAELPFSACEDDLATHFPLHSSHYDSLKLTTGNTNILESFRNNTNKVKKMNAVFGQARLLTQVSDSSMTLGCKYCGYCMSGCVYGSIYKPNSDLNTLIKDNLIDYEPGIFVHYLTETKQGVTIHFTHKNNSSTSLDFSRVFLAAGAISSARIILQSKNVYNHEIPLLSTGFFVAPLFRLKRNILGWPNINTQPGIFLEYKVPSLSEHWIHTQLSTPNELVLQKLGLLYSASSLNYKFKKRISEYLLIAACNMHSNHNAGYTIKLNANNLLELHFNKSQHATQAEKLAIRNLFSLMRITGCYGLTPLVQRMSSNHLGGSLPMKHDPLEETDTNVLGNPKGWSRVHVIDSSVFPTIPGTTIGLLAMANAKRIVDNCFK